MHEGVRGRSKGGRKTDGGDDARRIRCGSTPPVERWDGGASPSWRERCRRARCVGVVGAHAPMPRAAIGSFTSSGNRSTSQTSQLTGNMIRANS